MSKELDQFAEVTSGKYRCSPKLVRLIVKDWEAVQGAKSKKEKKKEKVGKS